MQYFVQYEHIADINYFGKQFHVLLNWCANIGMSSFSDGRIPFTASAVSCIASTAGLVYVIAAFRFDLFSCFLVDLMNVLCSA